MPHVLNTKHLQMGQTICGIVWGGVSLYSIPGGIVPSLGDQEGPRGRNHMPECSVGKPKGERVSRFPDVPVDGYQCTWHTREGAFFTTFV